jgi:hypothetical protein
MTKSFCLKSAHDQSARAHSPARKPVKSINCTWVPHAYPAEPAARQTMRASSSDSTRSFLRFLGRFFSISLAGLSVRLIKFSQLAQDTTSRTTAMTVRIPLLERRRAQARYD